jgi:hypothetical protein
MAIYRSDQAQLTFAVEAAPGGSPELGSAVTLATLGDAGECAINVVAGLPAGSRTLTVDGMTSAEFVAGDLIVIGTTATANSEVRRVEFVEGTTGIVIDTPTGFFHANNTAIKIITALTSAPSGNGTDADKYITFVPGIYETIEVPDPQMAIEPRYYLGTASKRNPYQFLKGQQTYTGSLGGFVLLDGRALRFPLGKVTSIPMESDGTTHAILSVAITIDQSGTYAYPHKGDVWLTVSGTHGLVANDHIVIYGAASVSNAEALATAEVRKVRAISTNAIQLDAPLQFDHADGDFIREIDTASLDHYKHEIFESVDLDSVSWHVHVRDSSETDANDFDRRYHGGKIGSLALSAEEGGLLTCGWDGVNFLGMNHNQSSHSGFTGNLPFYTLMQPIRDRDISAPGTISATATAEPYYFSQGQVKLFGSVFARVRSFSLSINNNEEPRYYLRRTMGRHRGPSEILEQRREYTCSVSLALPDATTNSSSAISVFKELLLEGDYGSGMQGFNIELRFDRGTNDSIVITIPDDGAAGVGGNNQGAFINTAPHAISDANPMEVEAEVLFRNLKIEIKDNIAVYP